MSPTVWSGVRTLARNELDQRLVGRPSRTNFIERDVETFLEDLARLDGADAPADVGMCEVVAEKATSRPRWKIGLSTQTSLMCPVPIQGSLVMSTSPGLHASRGPCRAGSGARWRAACR